jgi:peptidoglycan-associated lipoprotein
MKNRVWMNLVMAVLVAGLFLTVSCAKKTVVTDASTIEDQGKSAMDRGQSAEDAAAEAARIKAQALAEQMAKEKAAREMAAKERFENQDIHFEFDSAELTSMAKSLLKEKADWLAENPSATAMIEGHCDERGTTEYNLALGERRASVTKAYLVNMGIDTSRLNTISYGEEQPLNTEKSESAYQENRRAHFAVK